MLAHCGNMDPESIEEYIALGLCGLAKAITSMTPEQVRAGPGQQAARPGAGFPRAQWNLTRVSRPRPYTWCNGDEGDPGAFMNRSLMEGDPHRVLEGMMIAGYAIGASEGVFYVRAEYPLAVRRLRLAIAAAEKMGLLGDNILGTGFCFRARIKEGAGAFVCGEETALLASAEGKRGMPRSKPPYPAESGLYGQPTVINNVETLGNVPEIIVRGAEWFRQLGTERSAGTKTFALTVKVVNTGLVEIPRGFTLRDMIYEIGGGVPNGKRFKAVQIGGPSALPPESQLDLPVDYDTPRRRRHGRLAVSGDRRDNRIVEFARYLCSCSRTSRGKASPAARAKQMLALLQRSSTAGDAEDIALFSRSWGSVVKDASLCMLGKTAANPVSARCATSVTSTRPHVATASARPTPARRSVGSPSTRKRCRPLAPRRLPGRPSRSGQVALVIDQEMCLRWRLC